MQPIEPSTAFSPQLHFIIIGIDLVFSILRLFRFVITYILGN